MLGGTEASLLFFLFIAFCIGLFLLGERSVRHARESEEDVV